MTGVIDTDMSVVPAGSEGACCSYQRVDGTGLIDSGKWQLDLRTAISDYLTIAPPSVTNGESAPQTQRSDRGAYMSWIGLNASEKLYNIAILFSEFADYMIAL
ncbi:hypothetical protein [Shinella sp.]|uniref:hypothetical protein n=1 Tax=Shinella sp. TaxID=1870904 RepID=UPI003F7198FB